MHFHLRIHTLAATLFVIAGVFAPVAESCWAEDPLAMIVMDPLAAPLSCPCVEGYAQRDYTVLAKHMEASLGRPVVVTFAESLPVALEKTKGKADIVIGKQSVVRADAKSASRSMTAISQLTDLKGDTQQYGMIVVNKEDPARNVADLAGYTIIFGPSEADEKHSAALKLLEAANVSIPLDRQKIDEACSDGACKVIDMGPTSKTAAVISSYAQPLLEGCGTIKKGDLRVVGKTSPVPFVTVFVADTLDDATRKELSNALLDAAVSPEVLDAIESLAGFLPLESGLTVAKKK
ncbi:MAG: PhnD/SsuA/transferrin family substrate-binding protein [Rubripirellula sp.]